MCTIILQELHKMHILLGFIVGIAYIFSRSIEKWLANGWSVGVKRIEGDWQNKRVEVEMNTSTPQQDTTNQGNGKDE